MSVLEDRLSFITTGHCPKGFSEAFLFFFFPCLIFVLSSLLILKSRILSPKWDVTPLCFIEALAEGMVVANAHPALALCQGLDHQVPRP